MRSSRVHKGHRPTVRIVFWQNMLTLHQSAPIRALAEMPGCEVIWVVQNTIEPRRAALGWPVPDAGRAQVVVAPDRQEIAELVSEAPERSLHILSNVRHPHLVRKAFAACSASKVRMALMAERPGVLGLPGIARFVVYSVTFRRLRQRVLLVLAIGGAAREWYARCGFPPDRIYPYGYFMEAPHAVSLPLERSDGAVRLLFVGQLVRLKGLNVLLRALAGLIEQPWHLRIVGSGPADAELRALASSCGLSHRVDFVGSLPHQRCMEEIQSADVLVLPSVGKEGWGAVVSESLMRGVPVICTDRCGAADLVQQPWRGSVVKAGSVSALRKALEDWIGRGPRTPDLSSRLVEWSRCITGEAAAAYLLDVIRHATGEGPRRPPPWWDAQAGAGGM